MGQNWADVLVNWFPMLLLIAVWIYFFGRMGMGRKKYMTKYQADYIEQMKRQNDAFERIAAALEKNSPK